MHQPHQALLVHVRRMPGAAQEVAVLAPLVAEGAPEITSLGRDQLDHSSGRKFKTSVAHRSLVFPAPLALTPLVAPVHLYEMKIVAEAVRLLHGSFSVGRTGILACHLLMDQGQN